MTLLEEILQPMMNGTTDAVKQALLTTLASKDEVYKTTDQWRVFTAELWARGVTKEDFIKWANEEGNWY